MFIMRWWYTEAHVRCVVHDALVQTPKRTHTPETGQHTHTHTHTHTQTHTTGVSTSFRHAITAHGQYTFEFGGLCGLVRACSIFGESELLYCEYLAFIAGIIIWAVARSSCRTG